VRRRKHNRGISPANPAGFPPRPGRVSPFPGADPDRHPCPGPQADFDDLKELLIRLNPDLEEKLTELGESLDQLSPKSKPAELNAPMNKLGRFLKKLGDEKSDLNKILGGAKKGVATLQKVGKTYNKIAQWLALPQVPDLLLKKI